MSYIGLDQWEKGDKERTGMEKYISSPNPEVPTQKSDRAFENVFHQHYIIYKSLVIPCSECKSKSL